MKTAPKCGKPVVHSFMRRAKSPAEHITRRRRDQSRKSVPVIVPFLHRSKEILARKIGLKRLPYMVAMEGRLQGRRIAAVDPFIGSPAAVLTLEETIRCGYNDFLFLGACGGLADGLRIGDIIVQNESISEEGTSRLYTRSGPRFKPNSELTALLEMVAAGLNVDVHRGTIWTTDAPYRETPVKIRRYRRLGAIGVEMETSALFAVARLRRARVAGVLVVSDLLHDDWIIGWHRKAYNVAEDRAREIILKAALQLTDDRRKVSSRES